MPEASPHPLPESDRFARLPPGRSGLPGLPDSAHAASLPQILALRHPCRPGSPRQSRPGDPPPAADPRSRRRPGRSLTGFRPAAAAAPPSCSTRSPTRAMSGPCSARPGRSEFLPCGRPATAHPRNPAPSPRPPPGVSNRFPICASAISPRPRPAWARRASSSSAPTSGGCVPVAYGTKPWRDRSAGDCRNRPIGGIKTRTHP